MTPDVDTLSKLSYHSVSYAPGSPTNSPVFMVFLKTVLPSVAFSWPEVQAPSNSTSLIMKRTPRQESEGTKFSFTLNSTKQQQTPASSASSGLRSSQRFTKHLSALTLPETGFPTCPAGQLVSYGLGKGFREVLELQARSTECSSRGPAFSSQHPHAGS